jgi:predicted nucleic acid-binding protein
VRNYFLDTSALVKAYAVEAGSGRIRAMLKGLTTVPPLSRVVVANLVRPEAASALDQIMSSPSAAQRGFGSYDRRTLPAKLARQLGDESRMDVTDTDRHMEEAARLVWRHKLRGADAVHLATALATRQDVPRGSEFYFVSSDVALNRAAAAEGLEVIDPAA